MTMMPMQYPSHPVQSLILAPAAIYVSPDRDKFINYHEIMTEPIKAADGGLFNATGKGDLKIELPNFPGKKPITITHRVSTICQI